MTKHQDPRVRIIGRRTLSEGFIHLEEITLEQDMSDGETVTLTREVHDHGRAATILLFDPKRQSIVLVRQLRVPVLLQGDPAYMIEAPAGLLDDDTPEVAICREALEETGYHVGKVTHLFDAYMSPGSLTERTSFFVGLIDVTEKAGDGGGLAHEGEDIEVLEIPFDEAFGMIVTGEICDGKTIMLLQWAQLNRAKLSA
ncbi:GDP-mannose pyrophosphatase NudK [Ensifer sp. M14]|jgi:nudix-type nucleoside diphosphatase (YffH/AdpP family)|uniref:NUDIX domain-containing protein n=1 Tax=Sinorhizobium/Ensifer group TaxID=227292 RepID=UPI0009852FD7|nr:MULTISPECIES: NUDIX domain-containing protein [Sinorhizobium/Ensifer group]OOG75979.1 ADP-ribose pyrophosphatase [Sinorhizobium sp. A49]RDL52272.1 GDP-mannose pyrophosphatase NudK [Ensifer sp. M14]